MAGTGSTSIRSYNFFVSSTVAAGGFNANQHDFIDVDDGTNFTSKVVIIRNDSGNTLNVRFSSDPGTGTPHLSLLANEEISLDFRREKRIFLDGTGGSAFRVIAY